MPSSAKYYYDESAGGYRRDCRVCQERKAHSFFAPGDDVCSTCGGGTAHRCSKCGFWWPVGGLIDPDVDVCNLCIGRGDDTKFGPSDHIVYFMRAGEYVKIGVTTFGALEKRRSAIQTGNPLAVEVIGIQPGSTKRERELHRKWDDYRMSGEWFRFEGPIVEYAKSLQKP